MQATPRFLLALESATDRLSVAVLEDDRVRALREHVGSRAHSTALLSVLDATLREAGVALDAIGAMAITTGPGSFTSLRIGLATLKGLAFGRALPVVGISTLEAMALRVLEAEPTAGQGPPVQARGDVSVLALLDARRGEWYAGAWRAADAADDLPVEALPAGLYSPTRLAEDGAGQPVIAVCPEPGDWARAFEAAGLRIVHRVEGAQAAPRADHVARLARRRLARGEGGAAAALTARYLRRAQAEALRTGRAVEPGAAERTRAGPSR
ncbi:MAG: tRNA (adenosine(37)-N6)-threonylcarbamoyltransferase complex dimerization subunit type 1 TsaB [Myxococcota bacterium]